MFDFNRLYLETDFAEKTDPENWLHMAAALMHAAQRIDWTKKSDFMDWIYIPIYRMLMAFSVENLLKGIQIAEGAEPLTEGELSKWLSHGLRRHAGKISGIKFTGEEKKLLDDLEQYLLWAGRYPIPKKAERLVKRMHSEELHAAELALGQKLADYLAEQVTTRKVQNYLNDPLPVEISRDDE